MRQNLYHLLHFLPATEGWEMPPGLEALAHQLVESGKLRINADHERNFARDGELTFTARELTDPRLTPATDARLARHVPGALGAAGIAHKREGLMRELKKGRGIRAEKELQVARVLVQSAHPAVIQLLIQSGAEVYVSYSHNVADLMPVHEWQKLGSSSGLQSTEAEGAAVYVSAGGDPFFEGEQKTYVTDGFPALARMVVIAGQELGHFADLRRTPRGIIGRYSTDLNSSSLRADPTARAAWEADRQNVARLNTQYHTAGLRFLRRAETGLSFYQKRWRFSPPWLYHQLWRGVALLWFFNNIAKTRLCFKLRILPKQKTGEAIESYLADMAFNLTPEADAYRHPDPLIEEAIIVLEAVARVPQQVNKWGHSSVMKAWPSLYQLYYGLIINGCATALNQPLVDSSLPPSRRILIALRRRLRRKPGYYP